MANLPIESFGQNELVPEIFIISGGGVGGAGGGGGGG